MTNPVILIFVVCRMNLSFFPWYYSCIVHAIGPSELLPFTAPHFKNFNLWISYEDTKFARSEGVNKSSNKERIISKAVNRLFLNSKALFVSGLFAFRFEEGTKFSPITSVLTFELSFSQWPLLIDCPLYRLGLMHLKFPIAVLRLFLGLLN
jgi:hypothetical protein